MADEFNDDEAREAHLLARHGPAAVELFRAMQAHLLRMFPGRTLGVDLTEDEVRNALRNSGLIPDRLWTEH